MATVYDIDEDNVQFFSDLEDELERIRKKGYVLNSLHEGYGLLTEEYRELEEEVFASPKKRDLRNLKLECVQIAAMALRTYNLAKGMVDDDE
jgi:hypothetical protein